MNIYDVACIDDEGRKLDVIVRSKNVETAKKYTQTKLNQNIHVDKPAKNARIFSVDSISEYPNRNDEYLLDGEDKILKIKEVFEEE